MRKTISLFLLLLAAAEAVAEPVKFNRDIRPILNTHCLKCHGGVKEAGKLNLQFREQALRPGETGEIAVVPGKPEESAFIERLTTDDKSERMPKKEPPLPKDKIELLRRWIAEGAKWEDHWAYQPPKSAGKSVDALVGERLAREGLTLAPEAGLRTLARRLSLDLIGLPPEPERVDSLERDAAADKEAALRGFVDELLASPAYGERWAAPWLDLARYADSKGYEADRLRDMWRYRDWVIDALNADLPYDRFVTEQLAGDLLPNATAEQVIATAFHRNTPQNDEGGTDDEEFRTYAVLDRLNTTFDAMQGTTIGCVQCHGHPYDPFVHDEYYKLLAFFNNTADADRNDQAPTRKFRSRADEARGVELEAKLAGAEAKLEAELQRPEFRKAFADWLADLSSARELAPLTELKVASTQGKYRVEEDGRIHLESAVPARTTITVTSGAAAAERMIGAIALEALPDDKLPGGGPGGNEIGNFVLTRIRAALVSGEVETPLELASASATFEQSNWPVAEALKQGVSKAIPGEGESGWAIAGGTGKAQTATFGLAKAIALPAGAQLRVTLECENERWPEHVLGSFRLATSSSAVPEKVAALPKEIRELLGRDAAKWKKEKRAKVERHFFTSLNRELAELYQDTDSRRAELAALPVCELPIMQELSGQAARKTQVFHRGNWMDKAAEVQPATPQILNPWRDEYPRNRLGFARWLTNGENPLTARVQVNHVWEQLFGTGLVETLEDFGSQGDKPVYQDVLDELAVRFQTGMKWSQKALLREIVLSRVYRQASKATKAQMERDPGNRLLARGPRFRLGNEQIRDQALAIGGILSRKMFGKPVMPYQPPGTWLTPYEGTEWKTSPGEDGHRRAIYTLIRRSATYPSMVTFDAPNREFCLVRRTRTNTPLQALDLLNSPVFMEAAAGLAKRMAEPGGTLEEQLARGLAFATLRPARDYEIATLKKLHATVGGDLKLVANAILNLDEVLTKN
ncbi:MAG: hypothetical protein QOE70_6588 [Chthoniobacter sp.]|jgi:hypothetical protein|nr:hypothetical protein [Chthoniobacter sp.]